MKNRKKKSNKKENHHTSKQVYTGIVDVARSGTAFIVVEGKEEDIKVYPENLHSALDGDTVQVETLPGRRSSTRVEGKVIRVLKRRHTTFTGTIAMNNGFAFLVTAGAGLPDIFITRENLNNARDQDKAVVEITDWGNDKRNPAGRVSLVLDKENVNDTAMKEILIENGFPLEFPEEVLRETKALEEAVSPEELKHRRDFRESLTITIDPVDAKDFDDAISLKKLDDGDFEVGVHIADVSHYVTPKTALDEEAYVRATSVYLADRVLPMLPEKISNELCSLRPHEDKLTFSAVFRITPEAVVKKTWIGRTIIHSDHRFTYEEVQDIIEGKDGPFTAEVLILNTLSQKFRSRRIEHGAINFSSEEIRFQLDENAVPVGVEKKESKETHQLIEELMLLANKAVAEYAAKIKISKQPLNFPYRVHDIPDDEKLKLYVAFAAKFGHKFDISSPEGIARSFNEMLQHVKGKPEELVLQQLGIRTMAKAVYTTENIGHYGLGFEYYCHFTSPIRRYPDIMVHRLLADCLAGEARQDPKMEDKCKHCSEMERKAMEAERSANKYKQVEYMQKYIGEDFDAVISGVSRYGFWAETLDAKCEGMVSITALSDMDEFTYSDSDYALVGRRTGMRFRMGDTVKIKVAAASLEKRQLDYELVRLQPETEPPKKPRKGKK